MMVTSWGSPGAAGRKNLAAGGWGKLRTQVEWGTFHLPLKTTGENAVHF